MTEGRVILAVARGVSPELLTALLRAVSDHLEDAQIVYTSPGRAIDLEHFLTVEVP